MLDSIKLKKNSVCSENVTFTTKKTAPVEECINPFNPFVGKDGKNYIISYDDRLIQTTNCYAFAAGWRYPSKERFTDYIPGFLTGQAYSVENLVDLVKGDFEAVGREVYEVIYDIPEELHDGKGYWIKALYCSAKGDEGIHFMRKDKKSGRWIHKMGWEMPPKVGVRNLEFKDKKEVVLGMPQMQEFPRQMAEQILESMFPKEWYTGIILVRNELETCDSADYTAINEDDEILIYKALWVMRVSEP